MQVNEGVDVHVAVDVKVFVKVIVEDKVNLATKQRRRGATGSTRSPPGVREPA